MIPPRTNTVAVQAILGGTNENSNWDGITDLTPFIQTASAIVDRVNTGAQSKPWANQGIVLSAVELELIERWLSAHFYCVNDPLYMSQAAGGASGSYQRKIGDGFEVTEYGRTACQLDYSGTLRAIGLRQFAGGFWAGTPFDSGSMPNPADPDALTGN